MPNPYPDEDPNPAVQKIEEGHQQIYDARKVDQDEIVDALLGGQELADEIRTHERVLTLHGHEINPLLKESAEKLETLCAKLHETVEAVRLLTPHDRLTRADVQAAGESGSE